jgi:phosphoribosylanthranilate isomerase
MTRIKMCGFTRADDARAAVEAGADAIGLVFWPGSPRAVNAVQARAIVEVLPPFVTVVGVFVNWSATDIDRVCREAGLGAVQLHGDESEAVALDVGRPVIRSVPVGPGFEPERLRAWRPGIVPLLDAADPERRGGTGTRVDWTLAAAAARVRPIILAGGLSPENVADAIRGVRPAAVDVSSRIEDRPGVKNVSRMRAFVAAVRAADETQR